MFHSNAIVPSQAFLSPAALSLAGGDNSASPGHLPVVWHYSWGGVNKCLLNAGGKPRADRSNSAFNVQFDEQSKAYLTNFLENQRTPAPMC